MFRSSVIIGREVMHLILAGVLHSSLCFAHLTIVRPYMVKSLYRINLDLLRLIDRLFVLLRGYSCI